MRTALAAMLLFSLAACGGGDGGKAKAKAPVVEYTAEQNAAAIAALPEPLSAADYDAGRSVFARCRSCHTVASGGPNGVGPNLHGVIGTHTGERAEGFNYSAAMRTADLNWDVATLDRYLESPSGVVRGTRMAFAGIRDAEERRDVIAYIAVESER